MTDPNNAVAKLAADTGISPEQIEAMAQAGAKLFNDTLEPVLADLASLQAEEDPRVILIRLLHLYQSTYAIGQIGDMLLKMVADKLAPSIGLDAMRAAMQANVDPVVTLLTDEVAAFATSHG